MKQKILRTISVMLAVILVMGMLCISAGAVPEIRFSDHYNVVVGNQVTVTMTVYEVAGYDIWLSYNSNLLQYVGNDGRVSGGGGSLHVIDFASSGTGTLTVTLPFQTLAAGTAKVTIAGQELADGNGDTIDASTGGVKLGDSTVHIINKPTASSDSSLKSLTVSPGTLSPQFSPKTTSYSMTVSASTSKLAVTAVQNHGKATVSVSGTNLKEGVNWVTITVKAEDGSTTKYSIKVTRNAAAVTPTPVVSQEPEAHIMLPGGGTGKVAKEIDKDKIPAGFTLGKTMVEGIEVPAIVYAENKLTAVYVEVSDAARSGFYFIDKESGAATPMRTVKQQTELVLVDVKLAEIPEGYALGKFTIHEIEYDVLIPDGVEKFNHCLVNAINAEGKCLLYQYDPEDDTYQRYGFAITGDAVEPTPTPTPSAQPEPTPTPDPGGFLGDMSENVKLIIVAAVVAVLLILTIVFASLYGKKARECEWLELCAAAPKKQPVAPIRQPKPVEEKAEAEETENDIFFDEDSDLF